MKIITLRIFSLLCFCVFGLFIFSEIINSYKGAENSVLFLIKMLAHPNAIISNPLGVASMVGEVSVRLLIVWLFYYLGKRLWTKGIPVKPKEETPDADQTKVDLRGKMVDF